MRDTEKNILEMSIIILQIEGCYSLQTQVPQDKIILKGMFFLFYFNLILKNKEKESKKEKKFDLVLCYHKMIILTERKQKVKRQHIYDL